jgi:outer membrane protein TolC
MTALTLCLLQAQSIEQLIHTALKNHPSLKTIEHRLSAMDEKISLSQNFSNPDVSFTISDMQFEDPFSRDLEPMQYQAINFKQKFPWFGKLDARKSYTQAQKNVILDSYDAAKVKLAEEIRMTAYTIKEIEVRIDIVQKYIDVSKQNIKLYTSYASTDSQSHINSMNASLLLTKVKIKAANYKAILKSQKAKLKYLVEGSIDNLSTSLKMKDPKSLHFYLSKIEENPIYHMSLSKKEVALTNQKLQDLDKMPDPYVKAGYFNRQAYNDYASITIGASLPLYGSEKLKTEAARKEVLASTSASLDYKSALRSQIKTMYAKLTEAHTIYRILHTETLPQLEHMFELTQASIQQGGDLFAYTNLLEQKLDLEEQSTSIQAEYFRTEAKLKSLIGEIQ